MSRESRWVLPRTLVAALAAAGLAIGLGSGLTGCKGSSQTKVSGGPPVSEPTLTGAPATAPADAGGDPLALSFEGFDQTEDQGWRALSHQERWKEAGELIDRYIAVHPELTAWQLLPLNFHAGQMYAFAGEDDIARVRFSRSLIPNPRPDAPIQWNAYVLATIAFLEGDIATLQQSREVILGGATVQGCKPNLNIVNSLIANLGKPYREAYQAAGPPTLR